MRNTNSYPTTKEIIYLLGMGVLLSGTFIFPGLGLVAKQMNDQKRKYEFEQCRKQWEKFNKYQLRVNVKRMRKQKLVEIISPQGEEVITLTDKGYARYLQLKLDELSSERKKWDKKWRLIIYDIGTHKKRQQEQFRRTIRKINFLQLQKSVYLTPYPCKDEIDYLKNYFGLTDEVIALEISHLEDEVAYKKYFGIT